MRALWRELRFAVRTLSRRPGYTAVAVITLALGIAANTAVFSFVHGVLLQPLPFADPERVLQIEEVHQETGGPSAVTGITFLDLQERSRSFSNLAAFRSFPTPYTLTGSHSPQRLLGARVTEHFFRVTGVRPLHGRVFVAEEFQPGGTAVAILRHAVWQRVYGGDPAVVGSVVRLNDVPVRIVGVMPPEFRFPQFADLWTPMSRADGFPDNRRSHLLAVLGRLRPEVTLQQARAELVALGPQIDAASHHVDPGLSFAALPLQERMVEPVRPALLVFMTAVALLLMVACANVANLALARALSRKREIAVRAALGATRGRLAGQMLAESAVLSLAAGALGILWAWWGVKAMVVMAPSDLPRLDAVRLDYPVLVFAALLSLAVAAVFGVWPAWRASRADLRHAMQEGSRGSTGSDRRWSQTLVAAEVAVALVLLCGAALLGRSFVELLRVDLGFEPKNVLTFSVATNQARYRDPAAGVAFFNAAIENIRALPGVTYVAAGNSLPASGSPATTFELEGSQPLPGEPELLADVVAVTPDYFRTLHIPIVAGRGFTEQDSANAPAVVLVNETAARRFWPGKDPIGQRVTMRDWNEPLPAVVVGIVADVQQRPPGMPVEPVVYFSHAQFLDRIFGLTFLVRTATEPLSLAGPAAQAIWAVDKDQPLANLRTLEEVVAGSTAQQRFNGAILGVFAGFALLLALVGIYGVVSYSVAQRTQEIGIRMALGAARGDILGLVVRQGMLPAMLGIILGLPMSLALTRLLESLLFNIHPNDTLTFASVVVLLGLVALLACLVPARRAVRVDPTVALRYE